MLQGRAQSRCIPPTASLSHAGNAVTPANFLNALTGGATLGANNTAAGKVLQSGPNDDVFVFFSDHGAPGLIAFPTTTKTQVGGVPSSARECSRVGKGRADPCWVRCRRSMRRT
jgi:hypothetical protein